MSVDRTGASPASEYGKGSTLSGRRAKEHLNWTRLNLVQSGIKTDIHDPWIGDTLDNIDFDPLARVAEQLLVVY